MLDKFKAHIKENLPQLLHSKLLIACSGGLDSVLLAHLCKALHLDFALVHCNYKLRGEESEGDEQFVTTLAKSLAVPLYIKRFDTKIIQENASGSLQMIARDLRYTFFEELCTEYQFQFILTGHHANDSLETFLINFARGTGLEGLLGVPIINLNIIRPLLPFTRKELLSFANAHALSWREDSSNKSDKYKRNTIRNNIVPILEGLHPNFDTNFRQTLSHLNGSAKLLEDYALLLRNNLFIQRKGQIHIKIAELQKLMPLKDYLYLLFKPYQFTQWKDLEALLYAQSGKFITSKTHMLVKDRTTLILTKKEKKAPSDKHSIPAHISLLAYPIALVFESVDQIGKKSDNIAYLDKDLLKYPLVLRKWQKGDYFYPFGIKGSKKLSKYFKDEKMDVLEKEQQWLLCSGEDIVWVVGKRIDDRYKVKDTTTEILKVILN
ncbi:tRNA lysidine(34) synthetase TilS [Croceivirga radicis]|uniref:tRNA lysidine(34) synthetase TilS n=1 Tax=Croceivirga radicis TaxID=1929488 RepID=UPI000255AA9C|nr:tRNA lysidine(34) synthetase TilS [Croceivirga radicis]